MASKMESVWNQHPPRNTPAPFAAGFSLNAGMESHERTQGAQKEGVPAVVLFTGMESDLPMTLASPSSPFVSFALFCGNFHFLV
jgi:hypothetical protein